ncbi:MAG: ABC transporter permease, partial [Kosmotogaceae bacterium]
MLKYIVRRLILAIPVLIGVSILAFMIISAAPGDFLDAYRLNPSISKDQITVLESQFGLDRNVFVQYFKWLGNVLTGNFGYSFSYRIPVFELVWRRLGATLLLSIS